MKIYNDFPAKEVDELRSRAREANDPDELLAAFPSLRLKQGYKFMATRGKEAFVGSLSIVWAIPASNRMPTPEECEPIDILKLSRPFDTESSCFDALAWRREVDDGPSTEVDAGCFDNLAWVAGQVDNYKILRPPNALDNLMDAIEGDRTPWSYLSASIFAREAAEFHPNWHAQVWKDYFILNDSPFNYPDEYFDGYPLQGNVNEWAFGLEGFKAEAKAEAKPLPLTWNPEVIFNDKVITVKFYTFKFMGREEIHCFTDIYGPENYKFEFNYETIWRGERGETR